LHVYDIWNDTGYGNKIWVTRPQSVKTVCVDVLSVCVQAVFPEGTPGSALDALAP
jgi:hypothetical protein